MSDGTVGDLSSFISSFSTKMISVKKKKKEGG